MGATVRDVAKLAGVSTATVSRSFADPESVKESTRERVFDASRILNYSPNAIARAMAKQRTDRIAFLICKPHSSILDEFYAGICEGIMAESNRRDYQLLISTEDDWMHTITPGSKQIDGVILGGYASLDTIHEFQRQNIPIVMVNNRISGVDFPYVLSDDEGGVRMAVDHLLERGHRRIALLAGRFSPYICSTRYNAFVETLQHHSITIDSRYITLCDADIESAAKAAEQILRQKNPPTAIFGTNDVLAVGAYKAAVRLGLRIPEDVAIVGYDDSSLCEVCEPELTSIRINRWEMGRKSVEVLTALLAGGEPPKEAFIIPTERIVRGSS